MTSSVSSYNLKSLDFSFKTSSGDEISLNIYDKKSLDYSKSSKRGFQTRELLLTRERGISLHYEGDGIDERDKKEIETALKKVNKIVDKFFLGENKDDDKLSFEISNLIKPLKGESLQKDEYLKSSLLDNFEKILKENEKEKERLENIFKNILKDFKPSKIYA